MSWFVHLASVQACRKDWSLSLIGPDEQLLLLLSLNPRESALRFVLSLRSTFKSACSSADTVEEDNDGMESLGTPMVFNRQAFIERMTGDEEFARELAAAFADRLPGMISEVRKSIAQGSAQCLHSAVHKIKGSSANVGGEALSNLARRIEQEETPQGISSLISDLDLQAELLIRALKAWTSGHA